MWRWLKQWLRPVAQDQVQQLLAEAMQLGLTARDAAIAQEHLDYANPDLAFDQIVIQLFEYGTPLTADFYDLVEGCADSLHVPTQEYTILLLLIKATA